MSNGGRSGGYMAAGFSIESEEEQYAEDKCRRSRRGTHLPGNMYNNSLLEMLV